MGAVLGEGQTLPFLVAMALVELTPGPNMAYLGLVSLRFGRPAGLATVAGVTLGLSVYLLATAAGLSEMATRSPWVFESLRGLGAVYLFWLAIDAWREGDSPRRSGRTVENQHLSRFVLRGALANILNPKAAIFYLALMPGFTRPDGPALSTQVLQLGAIHLAVSLVVHLSIVAFAGTYNAAVASPRTSGAMKIAISLGLGASGVWLLLAP